MYNYICDICGCYLDPGEKCDCQDRKVKEIGNVRRIIERWKNWRYQNGHRKY